jgi:hypothetical protein
MLHDVLICCAESKVLSHRTFYYNDYGSWGHADVAETYITVIAGYNKKKSSSWLNQIPESAIPQSNDAYYFSFLFVKNVCYFIFLNESVMAYWLIFLLLIIYQLLRLSGVELERLLSNT